MRVCVCVNCVIQNELHKCLLCVCVYTTYKRTCFSYFFNFLLLLLLPWFVASLITRNATAAAAAATCKTGEARLLPMQRLELAQQQQTRNKQQQQQ